MYHSHTVGSVGRFAVAADYAHVLDVVELEAVGVDEVADVLYECVFGCTGVAVSAGGVGEAVVVDAECGEDAAEVLVDVAGDAAVAGAVVGVVGGAEDVGQGAGTVADVVAADAGAADDARDGGAVGDVDGCGDDAGAGGEGVARVAVGAASGVEVAAFAERVELRAVAGGCEVVSVGAGEAVNSLRLDAELVGVGSGYLCGDDALSLEEGVAVEAGCALAHVGGVGFAEGVGALAGRLRCQEEPAVARVADAVGARAFAVGVSAGRARGGEHAVVALKGVAGVAGETGSVGGVAGLAERVQLGADAVGVQEVAVRAFHAGAEVELRAVDVHGGGAADDAAGALEDVAGVAGGAGAGGGVAGFAERAELLTLSVGVEVVPGGAGEAVFVGVELLAVGVLEVDDALASRDGVAGVAGEAAAVGQVRGVAERVQWLAEGRCYVVEVVAVAGRADAACVDGAAVGVFG